MVGYFSPVNNICVDFVQKYPIWDNRMDAHIRFKPSEKPEVEKIRKLAEQENRSVPNMIKVLTKEALGLRIMKWEAKRK